MAIITITEQVVLTKSTRNLNSCAVDASLLQERCVKQNISITLVSTHIHSESMGNWFLLTTVFDVGVPINDVQTFMNLLPK